MTTDDGANWHSPGAVPPNAPYAGYPAPGAPVGLSRQMKLRNPFLVWLVWPILTLGIYHLVWYYKIHSEMLRLDPRQPINPAGSLLTIMFGWIIIVPPFVSYFNTGNRIANAQRAAGLTPTANPWIGFILLFIFGLTPLYYQFELNKVIEHLGAPEGAAVTLRD